MSRQLIAIVLSFVLVTVTSLNAETITIPNGSFESPATSFVTINIDSWQKSNKPDWYTNGGGFLWTQLTGGFKNTAPGSPDHIDNCDGNQAIWLFAVPEVGLFQDYDSTDWRTNQPPTHAFDVTYEIGKSYDLTVAVMGGNGNMLDGVTLELMLYCRDDDSNLVVVASTTVTNTDAAFPTNTHFYDYTVHVPTVQAGDFWANRKMGIQFLSTVNMEMQGGYWDLDNVRLQSTRAPRVTTMSSTNGQFSLTLAGEPGSVYEILAANEPVVPLSNWVSVATITNTTGTIPFIDTITNLSQRFYRARQN